MATKTRTQMIAQIRVKLADSGTVEYTDARLGSELDDALIEIAYYRPYETVKEITSDGTLIIDISSLTPTGFTVPLVRVDAVEYPENQPRNFNVIGDSLYLIMESAPTSGDTIYLHCDWAHFVDDTKSTLTPDLERLLCQLVAANAAISLAQSKTNKANPAGLGLWRSLSTWGEARRAEVYSGLGATRKIRETATHPRS